MATPKREFRRGIVGIEAGQPAKDGRKAAPDPASPVARLQRAAKRAKEEGDLTQAAKFAQAARDLGADQDEEAFKGVLRKLAKAKTP